jgi:hypothetical protein
MDKCTLFYLAYLALVFSSPKFNNEHNKNIIREVLLHEASSLKSSSFTGKPKTNK